MSVVYLIQKKVGDHIEEEHWGYMLDQQTGELIGAEQAFDQTGLEPVSYTHLPLAPGHSVKSGRCPADTGRTTA